MPEIGKPKKARLKPQWVRSQTAHFPQSKTAYCKTVCVAFACLSGFLFLPPPFSTTERIA